MYAIRSYYGEGLAALVTLELWRAPSTIAVSPITSSYLAIVAWSFPLIIMEILLATAMQCSGDSRTPMLIALPAIASAKTQHKSATGWNAPKLRLISLPPVRVAAMPGVIVRQAIV